MNTGIHWAVWKRKSNPFLYIFNAKSLRSLLNSLTGIPNVALRAMISFIHVHKGEGMPIPLFLLPEEPATSEIKWPNQLTKPNQIFPGMVSPRKLKPSAASVSSNSLPSDTKWEELVNWSRIEKNKPNILGLCPNYLKWWLRGLRSYMILPASPAPRWS